MPNLLLRDISQELYDALRKRAQAENRSMPAEAKQILTEAVLQSDARQRHQQAMASIIERGRRKRPTGAESLEMLREDRER